MTSLAWPGIAAPMLGATMGLAAPWALGLLLAVPVLVWLHRRRPRPEILLVPSLRFLNEEEPAPERSSRRRVDADLLLSLAAVVLLAVAAAGPAIVRSAEGRRILVVEDAGASSSARAGDGRTVAERAARVIETIRAAATDDDAIRFVRTAGAARDRALRDPSDGLRILVADRRPADLPSDVVFVGVGDPLGLNAGIVAVDAEVREGRRLVRATIWNDAPMRRRLAVGVTGREAAADEVDVTAFGAIRVTRELPVSGPATLRLRDPEGALGADDEVLLDDARVEVAFARGDGAPSAAVLAATRRALDASLPGGWVEVAPPAGRLFVGPLGDAPPSASVLEIGIARGIPVRPGPAASFAPDDPALARDLDVSSCEWLFPRAPAAGAPWRRIERAEAEGRTVTRWHADPGLGAPAAIDESIWPLFIENWLRDAVGEVHGAGVRARGLLDAESTRLGRDATPFTPGVLERAPRAREARRTELRAFALLAGAIGLALLWFRSGRRADGQVG